ncbi:MFS transporter [uncultured Kriegella sp.]|uniref:MFS transporter n=1 Tax=uncultured Kriegella sp. TaxID=1798910 RepID=UPI0030D78B69
MKNITKSGIIALLLTSSLTIMVGTAIAPSLTEIAINLDFSFSPGWLITLPSLGVVLFAPIIGRLISKLGAFKLLTLGLIPYAILGYSGGYISDPYVLIVNRILLGGSAVAIQVAVTTYIADYFEGQRRIELIAWQGMAIEVGGVVFLSIGGVLGEWHWRSPFLIYLIALPCFILVRTVLPKEKRVHNAPVSSVAPIIGTKEKKEVTIIFWSALLAMVLFFVSFVRLPQFLPESFEFSDSYVGYFMALISLIAVISASQMPKIVAKINSYNTVALGFAFFMLGYICFAFSMTITLLFPAAIFIGIGFGLTIPLLNHMMVEVSDKKSQGKNLGLYSMAVFAGQFLSTFIEFIANDPRTIFGIAAFLALIISTILFLLSKKMSVYLARA